MLLFIALLACGSPPERAPEPAPAVPTVSLPDVSELPHRREGRQNGELAPDGELYLFGYWDAPVRLSQFIGERSGSRATVVAFMASWCAACVASLPTLKALEDAHGVEDLTIVHLNVDTTAAGRERAHQRIREEGLRGPFLIASRELQRAWMGDSRGVPRYFFLNRIGQILVQDRGYGPEVAALMPDQLAWTLENPGWTER